MNRLSIKTPRYLYGVLLFVIVLPLGCFDLTFGEFPDGGLETSGTESETKPDSDTESDSGSDTETDSGSDTETDSESDTETDSESDTEPNECEDDCLIGGTCYPKGVVNPQNICEICDPDLSTFDWSSNDGAKCEDEIFCNGNDTCVNRSCSVNAGDPCSDDGIFCNGNESCDELNDLCSSSGSPCEGEDICIEDEAQCCQPNLSVGPPVCNGQGDAVQYDSCGHELLVQDCLDDVHACLDGVCACQTGLQGENCDKCHFMVRAGLLDYEDHDGNSWNEPFETVQEGIDRAKSFVDSIEGINACEVWVASGTYRPTEGQRTNTIHLESGVALYGGFAGDEMVLDERDIAANPTVLSGDLNGDDEDDFENNDDNAFHVVTGSNGATIDGFIITGGNATNGSDNEGGGMLNTFASPTIANSVFRYNTAADGGGMANAQSNPTIINCVFEGNEAGDGGGIKNTKSDPTITNCLFVENIASDGAGMHNTKSTPVINGCTFENNIADEGGGVKNVQSDSTLSNCVFQGNIADAGGGLRNVNSFPFVINSTFYQNEASKGGGMSSNNGSAEIVNCIFWANEANTGAEIESKNTLPLVTFSDVEGGCTVLNGFTSDDTGNIDAFPMFAGNADLRLTCPDPGSNCSPCVDTGNNEAVPLTLSTDSSGAARIVDGDGDSTQQVDMGAYELQ